MLHYQLKLIKRQLPAYKILKQGFNKRLKSFTQIQASKNIRMKMLPIQDYNSVTIKMQMILKNGHVLKGFMKMEK